MNMKRYTQYMYSYPHKTAYGPLEGVTLNQYLPDLAGPGHDLYLHLPFCETKCGYCNLFSVTGLGETAIDRYLDTVERQLRQYEPLFASANSLFTGLTIGGGTPLLLTEAQLERCFAMIRRYTRLTRDAEIIIETAPNQTAKPKLALLKDAGVTRVSMGIQSFFDEELKVLKRSHRAEKARESLDLLMNSGFSRVNADFIYGVPGQSVSSFLSSVKEAVSFGPDELFLYPLYVKHGAALEQELNCGLVLDEDLAFRQYEAAAEWLASHGYRQDSMRRFVRPESPGGSREFSDCGFGSTLSLGCGGRSYLGNLHYCTPYAVTRESCLEQLVQYEETTDFCAVTHGILLSEEEQKRRFVIRHLLILPGLPLTAYREAFHGDAAADFPILHEWTEQGFLKEQEDCLALTEKGMGLSDYLGPMLISKEVQDKMNQWEAHHGTKHDPIQREFKEL